MYSLVSLSRCRHVDTRTRLDSFLVCRSFRPLDSDDSSAIALMVLFIRVMLVSLSILQTFTAFLQFIGEHYPATGQGQLIFFETNDRMSTKDWKAVSAALDRNQPTTKFSNWNPNYGENPLTDRSSGVGPMHCIEP